MLRVGKTGAADRPAADLALHPLQPRGGGEAAQGLGDGIEQAEEKEREIVGGGEAALGVVPGGVKSVAGEDGLDAFLEGVEEFPDRKSTRLNSSHQ